MNEALKETDELDYLMIQLENRVARFSYRKTDGTVREAVGTFNLAMLDLFTNAEKRDPAVRVLPIVCITLTLSGRGGVASAPKTSSQSTNFRSMRPGAKAPGLFSVSFSVYRRAFLHGNHSLWQPAAGRLRLPFTATRSQPPELMQPGAGAARPTRIRLRSASELAGWGRAAAPSQQQAR